MLPVAEERPQGPAARSWSLTDAHYGGRAGDCCRRLVVRALCAWRHVGLLRGQVGSLGDAPEVTSVKKHTAWWSAGGIALAAGSVALGVTVNWGVAALVGGLLETAYFGLLPLGLSRRRDQSDRINTPAEGGTVTQAGGKAKATMTDKPPEIARLDSDPPLAPAIDWTDELSSVLDHLVVCLPDPIDIGQIAVQCGMPPHLIERSGDRAVNRWQSLLDRAFLEGGEERLNLVLTRAIRRSGADPRLVAAVRHWRESSPGHQ